MNYLQYPHEYCPYCYSKLSVPTEFYCAKENCKGAVLNDKIYYNVDYRGLPMCNCGGGPMRIKCSNEKCRNAGNIIPPVETAIVVIAGMTHSGKSTFLLDVVNSQSSKTGIVVSPKSHALIEWRKEMVKKIKNNESLDSTLPENDNFSSVVSMQSIKSSKEICLSLTDRPGEETQDLNKMLGLNYMFCADYIILLIDLMNIPGVKEELDSKGIKFIDNVETTSNETAIDNILTILQSQRGKYGKNIPFMLGISKWDYIEEADMCPPGFSIGCKGNDLSAVLNEKGKFDKKRWKSNSTAIRNFLIMHNESEVVNKLESYFKDVSYFAFSNFGTVPKFTGNIQNFPIHNPCHIMDPFYYILHDKRII